MALPLAVAWYRNRKTHQSEARDHRTPAELMLSLLALLMHWFPDRKFVFAGDNAYGSHAMARFAYRHRRRITLVSKIVSDLFVMYTMVVTFYDTMPASSTHLRSRIWLGKDIVTFSDMIISVRHHLWCEWVFEQTPGGRRCAKTIGTHPKAARLWARASRLNRKKSS